MDDPKSLRPLDSPTSQNHLPISVVFANTDEASCILYHKHFRDTPNATVLKQDVMEGEDCLVIPLPSSYGLFSSKSCVNDIMSKLGKPVQDKIVDHIVRKYLGEQPVGSAFIIKNNSKTKFTTLVVVSLFRVATCRGDDMAWLDPGYVPLDFAYAATRGVLLKILQYNATSRTPIRTAYFPDFWKIRKEMPGGEFTTPSQADEMVSQMALAFQSFANPKAKEKDWAHAIFITSSIIRSKKENLLELLDQGVLQDRGLYNSEELDLCMSWARDSKDPKRQEAAIQVLAACLHRRDTQFNVPKYDVAKRIASRDQGCLPTVLSMVFEGKTVVHTEINPNEIKLGTTIGVVRVRATFLVLIQQGNAGKVYRGVFQGKHCAIKKFNIDTSVDVFKQELSIMCLVQHPNLVKCYGGVTLANSYIIIQELMQSNLSSILANRNIQIDLGLMIEIASGIASGISFLHVHCRLIHRDLKSFNVLINACDSLQVKITDFGISRIVAKSQMTANVGTIAWIAPEVFGNKKYNEKADIYSFGIILWELATRELPFSQVPSFAIPLNVLRGERPPLPKDFHSAWKKLITECWQKNPKKRPSITSVTQTLKKLYESLPPSSRTVKNLDLSDLFGSSSRTESHPELASKNQTLAHPSLLASSSADDDSKESSNEIMTCKIPSKWATSVLGLESNINNYFSLLVSKFDAGTISVQNNRFLVVPHSILSDISTAITQNFDFPLPQNAHYFVYHLQYILGFLLAKKITKDFFLQNILTEPLARILPCCIYSAFLGIGFVEISESSTITDDIQIIISHFTCYLEGVDKSQRDIDRSFFIAGWLSGWMTVASGSPKETALVATSPISTKVMYTFVTSNPSTVLKEVKEYSERSSPSKIAKKYQNFLRQRTETPSQQPGSNESKRLTGLWDPSTSSGVQTDWFLSALLSVRSGKLSDSDSSTQLTKNFKHEELDKEEIREIIFPRLQQFIIDPSTATVGRLVDEKSLLLDSDVISDLMEHFEAFAKENQVTDLPSVTTIRVLSQKIMYLIGSSIGKESCLSFCQKMEIGKNPISWLKVLSIYLLAHGWSFLEITTNLHAGLFQEKSFHFTCVSQNSFEANRLQKGPKTQKKGACVLHCGFIAGWVGACLKIPVVVVETKCVSLGDSNCEFTVSTSKFITHHLPKGIHPAFPLARRRDIKKTNSGDRESPPLSPLSRSSEVRADSGELETPKRKKKIGSLAAASDDPNYHSPRPERPSSSVAHSDDAVSAKKGSSFDTGKRLKVMLEEPSRKKSSLSTDEAAKPSRSPSSLASDFRSIADRQAKQREALRGKSAGHPLKGSAQYDLHGKPIRNPLGGPGQYNLKGKSVGSPVSPRKAAREQELSPRKMRRRSHHDTLSNK